jgi:XRE family transcriptional regulator, regulator of sulfur utilization
MPLKDLKKIRKQRKISIEKVSEVSGVRRETIGRAEHDKGNPSWKTLEAIAKAIGVKIVFVPLELLEDSEEETA